MAIQQRIPATGVEQRSASGQMLWMDPARDLAHAFGDWVCRAAEVLEMVDSRFMQAYIQKGGDSEDIRAVLHFLRDYIAACHTPDMKTPGDIFKAYSFEKLNLQALETVSYALMTVLLSGYFHGARQATFIDRPGSNPISQITLPQTSTLKPRKGIRRWLFKFFTAIAAAL